MRKRKKNRFILLLVILIITMSLGYALLTQNISIMGTSTVKNSTWDIYFDNVQINSNSVSLSTGDSAATIDSNDNTLVNYTVTLSLPGDFYEFTVDAVNDGSIDAMIDTIVSKYNGTAISSTNPIPNYLTYSVMYADEVLIEPNHLLSHNSTETYKVKVEFNREIEEEQLPSSDQTLSFSFKVNYVQANENAIKKPTAFAQHSWETIIANVRSGKGSFYHVGDTKSVALGNNLGTHPVRVANTSTPSECSTEGFSQTACGFVIEFADVVTTHKMNPNPSTNVGGWPASSMRSYVNSTFYSALPEDLRSGIINTTVVSSHGSTAGETNFTSTDKIYLLSTHEVWVDNDGDPNAGLDYRDTAYDYTRQLDYYASYNVTLSNFSKAKKTRNGGDGYWWLRTADINYTQYFSCVYHNGNFNGYGSSVNNGVSPAFRIG